MNKKKVKPFLRLNTNNLMMELFMRLQIGNQIEFIDAVWIKRPT